MLLFASSGCGPDDTFSDGLAGQNSSEQEGIIGGRASGVGDYPSTGAILFVSSDRDGSLTGSMLCTGTLIEPDVVLAAAHCNLGLLGVSYHAVKYYFSRSLDVANFGKQGVVLPPKTTRIAKVVPHPDFSIDGVSAGLGHGHDIALMYLSEAITDVAPAALIKENGAGVLRPGQWVSIVGYGRRHNYEREDDYGVKYQGVTKINRVGRNEMQISRGDPQPHKCHGDSGGPTFMSIAPHPNASPRLTLIGVTSHAFDESDCLSGGVDTRVDRYVGWIASDMRRACRDGRRPACSRVR